MHDLCQKYILDFYASLACDTNTKKIYRSISSFTLFPFGLAMFFLFACFSTQSPSVSSKPPTTVQKTVPSPVKQSKRQEIQIFFWNVEAEKLIPVTRTVSAENIEQNVLDSLYKGPSSTESSLTLLSCASTGATLLSLKEGLAKVQLQGDCSGCGSMSIYDSIVSTLKALPSVQTVHLLDPQGKTQSDGDNVHARPACLNP